MPSYIRSWWAVLFTASCATSFPVVPVPGPILFDLVGQDNVLSRDALCALEAECMATEPGTCPTWSDAGDLSHSEEETVRQCAHAARTCAAFRSCVTEDEPAVFGPSDEEAAGKYRSAAYTRHRTGDARTRHPDPGLRSVVRALWKIRLPDLPRWPGTRSEAVGQMIAFADRVCACQDLKCVTDASDDLVDLMREHADTKVSREDADAIAVATERATRCITSLPERMAP